jgi:hypothetical protein
VDLFADGKILPQLLEVMTSLHYSVLLSQIMANFNFFF